MRRQLLTNTIIHCKLSLSAMRKSSTCKSFGEQSLQIMGIMFVWSFPQFKMKVFSDLYSSVSWSLVRVARGRVADAVRKGTPCKEEWSCLSSSKNIRKSFPHSLMQWASSTIVALKFLVKSAFLISLENVGCLRHISGLIMMIWYLPFLIS